MQNDISEIIQSNIFNQLDFNGFKIERLKSMLYKMILIRKAEEKISDNIENGIIKCPCHLAIGQEAIPTAISELIQKNDKIFGAHRSHGHYLSLNLDTFSLFAEILGKVDGCSSGFGGSMHTIDIKNNFYGSVPIVGATIPIATGAALANKFDKNGSIAVSYFGDGACEEGVLHESLNLASVMKLPIVYVCENNLFSSHLRIDLRQPNVFTSRFAKAHKIESLIIDGNNVLEIYKSLDKLISNMRKDPKPLFIEAITYRWKGHVGHRDDIDVGVKRSEDLRFWKEKDPIKRLIDGLIQYDFISEYQIKEIELEIDNKIESDWIKATNSKFPIESLLIENVYS